MAGPVSPLFLERYELKYLIPFDMVEPISKYVEMYCEMDYYSQITPDGFYTINSLYLDSPSFHILHGKENAGATSFNLRIRSYGDNPKPPYFFEAKHKVREFVKKKRAKVYREDWPLLFDGDLVYEDPTLLEQNFLVDFLNTVATHNARPQILTQYRRKAYLSLIDDYARITFDRDLRYQVEETFNLIPDNNRLCHYDHPESFGYPGLNVILELKCERKIPVWFVDLIQKFELVQGNFSKFGNSSRTAFGKYDELLLQHYNPLAWYAQD